MYKTAVVSNLPKMDISLCLLVIGLTSFIDGRHFRNDYVYKPAANGWMKFHQVPAPWEEARIRCYYEGGVLASPLNANMHSTMQTISQSASSIFTGFSAYEDYHRSDVISVEGVSLESIIQGLASWAPGEPDNKDGLENCISMFSNGSLADVSCNQPRPYICYKKNSHLPSTSVCGTIDPEYTLDARTGSCYKFHRFGQAWARASMACVAEGGYLAIINSQAEAQVLIDLANKNPGGKVLAKHRDWIALGFRDWSEHGIWMTVQGQTLEDAGYNHWAGGQPDNFTAGEYCGCMFRNAHLNDIWCQDALPFICEKAPRSLDDKSAEDDDENKVHQ